ncbi:MAG: hypothetical protein QXR24_07105, partial [Thermosphaera sp.]
NQPPSPRVYDPLIYGTGDWSFVAYAAEYHREKNNLIVVAGESLYGDYEPAWASLYYGVQLDGPKFVTNLIRWFIKIIETPPTETPLTEETTADTFVYFNLLVTGVILIAVVVTVIIFWRKTRH